MIVKVEFTVDTEDFEEGTFKKEIKQLIEDIDPYTEIITFDMKEIK